MVFFTHNKKFIPNYVSRMSIVCLVIRRRVTACMDFADVCHFHVLHYYFPHLGNPSPQPERRLDRFSRFCTAHGIISLYFTKGSPSPSIAPSNEGIWTSSSTWFPGLIGVQNLNDILIVSVVFSQLTAVSLYFRMGRPIPSTLPVPIEWSGLSSNVWFHGPTRVLNPNGISIGSAVFAVLTNVTDRETERPTDRQTTLLGL